MTNAEPLGGFEWIAQHGGPVVRWADKSLRHHVVGKGLADWFAYDGNNKSLSINKHILDVNGTRMLSLLTYRDHLYNDTPIRWESTLMIGENRYVRAEGSVIDFPTALAQAEAYTHESRLIGNLTWWKESDTRWVSWLGEFTLKAIKMNNPSHEPLTSYWHFEISGNAPTLEEAALLAALGRAAKGTVTG